VLEENYSRYPSEAMRFLNNNYIHIKGVDIEKIKMATKTLLFDRTFEQLHWIRILYFLKNTNQHIVQDVLVEICDSDSLYEAVKRIMLMLLNEYCCESIN